MSNYLPISLKIGFINLSKYFEMILRYIAQEPSLLSMALKCRSTQGPLKKLVFLIIYSKIFVIVCFIVNICKVKLKGLVRYYIYTQKQGSGFAETVKYIINFCSSWFFFWSISWVGHFHLSFLALVTDHLPYMDHQLTLCEI